MNWLFKLDNVWKGLIIGLIFPAIVYFFIWMFTQHQLSFPVRFTKYLIGGQLLGSYIKGCGIGNLLLFYIGLQKKMDSFNKGIIISLLFYVALVAYVMYYIEPFEV